MKKTLSILIFSGVLCALLGPLVSSDISEAQQPPTKKEAPERLLEDGVKMILGAIKLILRSIPEYKAPEVLENGDIIIRRVKPPVRAPKEEDKIKKEI